MEHSKYLSGLRIACVNYINSKYGSEYVGLFVKDLDRYLHNNLQDIQYNDAFYKLTKFVAERIENYVDF